MVPNPIEFPRKFKSANFDLSVGPQGMTTSPCPTKLSGQRTLSVTRIGKIPPLWRNFMSLWQIFDGFFLFVEMLSQLWQICYIIALVFIVANGKY